MARSIHTKTISSSTRYLEDVRRFVEDHALKADFPEETVTQFKMAVDEACANVIEHAYGGQEGHEVEISILIDSERFTVRIRDEGEPFNRETYREPDLLHFTKNRKQGGLGVHIMRRLMDRVEYRTRGNTNEVLLTKYRHDKPDSNNSHT